MARLTLSQQITVLRAQIADLTKERDEANLSLAFYRNEAENAAAELEQAHAVLDIVDGTPAKTYDTEYGKKHRNVVTRLAGTFLTIAKNGGVK